MLVLPVTTDTTNSVAATAVGGGAVAATAVGGGAVAAAAAVRR